MMFQKFKGYLRHLWLRFNLDWAKATEMQNRIDEARSEHLRRYGIRWKI